MSDHTGMQTQAVWTRDLDLNLCVTLALSDAKCLGNLDTKMNEPLSQATHPSPMLVVLKRIYS